MKQVKMSEKEYDDHTTYNFNEGRLNADKKWVEAINERIKELEAQVGIPELRRLRESVRYRWQNGEEIHFTAVKTRKRAKIAPK